METFTLSVCFTGGTYEIVIPRDGNTELHTAGRTEEGYRSETHTYRLEGEYVIREIHTYERDCDGCHEYRAIDRCPTDTANTESAEWEDISRNQRDHTAEAAGY